MLAKKSPNPTDKHVGARVRMRRMMIGKTQEWLGDALGLTFQQVQKYEKGANRIGASRLQQISAALQVQPAFFFEGAPGAVDPSRSHAEPMPDYVAEFCATRDGIDLAKAFTAIASTKVRARIVALVEGIAEECV